MIIATDSINIKDILELKDNKVALLSYCKKLIPKAYSHIDGIYHNQRYYIAVEILRNEKLNWETKQSLVDVLTSNLHVVGYLDTFITLEDVERYVDIDKVNKYREGDKV